MATTSTTRGNNQSSPLGAAKQMPLGQGTEGVCSKTKSELAQAAGVSLSTLSRWLHSHDQQLQTLGVGRNAHILNPLAVQYVCEQFGIDI